MENELLLIAVVFCGFAAAVAFAPAQSEKIRNTTFALWFISAIAIINSVILLESYLIKDNYSFQYVYNHINNNLPLLYKISALWSGQEGSFLLWSFIMAIGGFFVWRNRGVRSNKIFGIYATVTFCVYLMCYIVEPFKLTSGAPVDGLGLTQALQDPWMVIHPPLVFIAYTAMAVLFSLAIGIAKGANEDTYRRISIWLRIAAFFLGFGILSGSIWAYRALGWGGYWAWDPIENAALVPWLILIGFLHYKRVNPYAACIIPFSVACFGVFLARSGILFEQSTHAYANGNAAVTVITLSFIFITLLTLVLISIRKGKERSKRELNPLERNGRLVFCLFGGYAFLILLGTVSPLILKMETPTLYYAVISVIFALITAAFLLYAERTALKRCSVAMVVVSTVLVIGIIALTHFGRIWWLVLVWVCLMPLSLGLVARSSKGIKYFIPHLGIILMVIGIIASSVLGQGGYALAGKDCESVNITGKEIAVAELAEQNMLIKTSLFEDIIIQSAQVSTWADGRILVPYATRPLVLLFWIGGFILIFAPLLDFIPGRFLNRRKKGSA